MSEPESKWNAGATVAMLIAAAAILVPLVQCWLLGRENARLQTLILQARESNRSLQAVVQRSHDIKTTELVSTGDQVNKLEGRLERNERLAAATAEAQQKLSAVKELMEEHRRLAQDLDQWKRMFPELFSGY